MCALLNPERFPAINRPLRREEVAPAPVAESAELRERRAFYTRLGKPELAEKYGIFEIPAGMSVKDLQDVGSELKYTLYSPSAQAGYEQQTAQFAEAKGASEKFWLGQYPTFHKYAGKYAPVEVPQGMKIKSVTETGEGLTVTFFSPEAEEQAHASRYFWSTQGYPQFAGKYAPVEVPAGAHIEGVAETPQGLQVTFSSLEMEAQQRTSQAFYQSIGYPQFGGKYAPFTPMAGREIESVQEVGGTLQIKYALTPQEQYLQQNWQGIAIIGMLRGMGQQVVEYNRAVAEASVSPLPVKKWERPANVVQQRPETTWTMPVEPSTVFIPTPTGGFLRSDYEVAKVERTVLPSGVVGQQYTFQPKNWQQIEQLASETQAFKSALESGEISGAEYNTAIYASYLRGQEFNSVLIPKGQIVSRTKEGAVVVEPLMIKASGSVFGVFEPEVAGYGVHGEAIPFIKVEGAPKGLSYAETRALTGMALVTSVATPINLPLRAGLFVAGAGGAGVGVAESFKYVTTGEHLTSHEVVASFAMGEFAGVGLMRLNAGVIQPRVERSLSESYAKTLEGSELWKPTVREQILMKLTGAKPQAQFLQTRAMELLGESYKQQAELNEAVLMSKPMPEGIEGRTALQAWTPTAKEAEIMRLVGVQPKVPATSINVARVTGGERLGFTGLQRQIIAEDIFDFSIAPKTSMQLYTVAPPQAEKVTTLAGYSRLPLYFGLGKELVGFKEYFAGETTVEKPVEPYVKEPLSFEYPRMYYGGGKYVSYVPLAPSKPIVGGGGMKPLWESVGAKVSGAPEFSVSPILQTVTAKEVGMVVGGAPVLTTQAVKPVSPFVRFVGAPYYPQTGVEEAEEVFLSYPEAGLPTPALLVKQETRISQVTKPSLTAIFPELTGAPVGLGQAPRLVTETATKDLLKVGAAPSTALLLRETQVTAPFTGVGLSDLVKQRERQGLMPALLVGQGLEEFGVVSPKLESFMEQGRVLDVPAGAGGLGMVGLPFYPEGVKVKEAGYGLPSSLRFAGVRSRKRVYPILTGKEVLGLAPKKKKGGKR